jgi:hypothetical protein
MDTRDLNRCNPLMTVESLCSSVEDEHGPLTATATIIAVCPSRRTPNLSRIPSVVRLVAAERSDRDDCFD